MKVRGSIVSSSGITPGEVTIEAGIITNVSYTPGPIDRTRLLFPGFYDVHVHCREDVSGEQLHKESFETASLAAIRGGVFGIADMPNNIIPPSCPSSFRKKQIVLAKADTHGVDVVMYGLLGENTPHGWGHVPFKVYMSPTTNTGSKISNLDKIIDEFLDFDISIHAENCCYFDKTGATHNQKRPQIAEEEAVKQIIEYAERRLVRIKICHVSSSTSLKMIHEAKQRGVRVSAEVTPHHLFFSGDKKLHQINPPVRDEEERKKLLELVKLGYFDYLATDHSPHTLEEKEKGISGMPHLDTYGLFVAWLINEGVAPEIIAKTACENPGRWLSQYLPGKRGKIEEGYWGNIVALDLTQETTIHRENLETRCGWSPFEEFTFPGKITERIIRGRHIV